MSVRFDYINNKNKISYTKYKQFSHTNKALKFIFTFII